MFIITLKTQQCKKRLSGFTLIELIVVIAIIAVLSGVSLFALQGSRESARDARRKADLETIRSALELYKADCGDYPSSITWGGNIVGDGDPATCVASNIYLQKVPQDSVSGRTYRYNRLTSVTYELCAALETDTTSVGGSLCAGGCGATCSYRVTNP